MTTEAIDVERRRPVWEVISDLWRDTELQDDEVEHIAEVLAESGYTEEKLHEIYAYEVAPAVWTNLFTFYPIIPEVWAGFDPEWLSAEIMRGIERQGRSGLYGLYVRCRIGRWMRTLAVKEDWAKVLKAVESKKAR